jgi:tellurium resistance protein TerD
MDQVASSPTLVKGEKVDLTKGNPGLKVLMIGLGWDVNAGAGGTYDLDAFALLCTGGKCDSHNNILFFNNKTLPGLTHGGDNLTGQGEGDDEKIIIDLDKIPANFDEVVIGVNIFQAKEKGNQNFGQVKNSFIRIVDNGTQAEMKRFDLNEDYSAFNAVVMGKIYRKDGEWRFQAIGTGINGDIFQIADGYRS